MIAFLHGLVSSIDGGELILDVNGVGYLAFCSKACLERLEVGQKADIYIHTEVREDNISLYGFVDTFEKQCFLLLKKVKGVGAKSASDIISQIRANELLEAISRSDLQYIQKVKGIGKKTAERIILELKDQVQGHIEPAASKLSIEREVYTSQSQALEALCALGFVKKDAERMLQQLQAESSAEQLESLNAGQVVSEALRYA